MSFLVRRAAEPDLAAVGRVTVEGYHADGLLDLDAGYADHLRDARRRHREAEIWVAADPQDGVLGSVTFCAAGSPYQELAGPGEGEFRMLAVSPAARGAGVGEALVRRCVERSRELGYGAVVLCSMREMSTAHRLYRRLGFGRTPEKDWSPVAGVELVAFRLDLS